MGYWRWLIEIPFRLLKKIKQETKHPFEKYTMIGLMNMVLTLIPVCILGFIDEPKANSIIGYVGAILFIQLLLFISYGYYKEEESK